MPQCLEEMSMLYRLWTDCSSKEQGNSSSELNGTLSRTMCCCYLVLLSPRAFKLSIEDRKIISCKQSPERLRDSVQALQKSGDS